LHISLLRLVGLLETLYRVLEPAVLLSGLLRDTGELSEEA